MWSTPCYSLNLMERLARSHRKVIRLQEKERKEWNEKHHKVAFTD